MNKLSFVLIFFVIFGFMAFADDGGQDEIDFLLFLPDSSDQFVNEEQAMIQLDKLAEYLNGKDLILGQIHVYGYAANFVNDTAPMDISRDRALFVINELEKRGVLKDFFADPIAYGAVDLWGGNTDEKDRSPNRRVRILLDDVILTPSTFEVVEAEIEIPDTAEEEIVEETVAVAPETSKSRSKFPWLLLLLLLVLIPAILFLLFKRCWKKAKAAAVIESITIVNLDDEILFRAYELYQWRKGQSEDAIWDWHTAVCDVCSRYKANGYQAYYENGSWWAKKSN
ncbi:MAG: OmpA family protein [Treponema sp.]|jgi:hypothetical protein|nr:OmpA family protein [Treponema sp.]